ANRIYKLDAGGKAAIFKENTGAARGLRFGPDGRLYASQTARKRIVSYGPGGDEKVVAQNVEANDLALSAAGGVYFADTAHKTVGYIDAKGAKRVVFDGGEIPQPTSLALSPDQSLLVVGDGMTKFSWSFQVAADGGLVNGEPY